MRSYRNPFRHRTSEQETMQGLRRFLRTFGAGALDMLPEQVWDRPLLLQSAPGAGKTTLFRTFTVDALKEIAGHPDEYEALYESMSELGAIEGAELRLLGVMLPLKKDFRAVDDLRLDREHAAKVFFRLLDVQLVRGLVESLSAALPDAQLDELTVRPSGPSADALERIGGGAASDLLAWAKGAHRELLDQLDSVLPPDPERLQGHHVPYAIRALSGARFCWRDAETPLRPLLMFDDGQDIGREQRGVLLDALADRELELHRWFAERYEALSADEVVADGQPDRGHTVVRLEVEARQLGDTRRRGHKTRRFERLLVEIADLRSSNALRVHADDDRSFAELLDSELEPGDAAIATAIAGLDDKLAALTEGNPRYDKWLALAARERGERGAVFRRVLQILITRDRARNQDTLFSVALNEEELRARWASGLTEAAELHLRREARIPFYTGTERLAKLASENIEQHITLGGELFEEILARVTLNQSLALEPRRQDAIVRQTSETMWRRIPRLLANGREIQQLLLNIASLCRAETYRPTAPYPPGATGTAISMSDRRLLLDEEWRERTPGADRLFLALAGAIGHNLLRADLDYAVKNNRWMVLYLNRLLCARFGLPLGYGGFRERPIHDLCEWMAGSAPAEEELVEPMIQEQMAV